MPTDLKAVVQTLCLAFDTGPVTEWSFPRDMADWASLAEGFFRVVSEMILGQGGHVAATPGHEAVGVWSPAGAPEPTEAELADYASQFSRACGDGAERALTIMRAVGAHRPGGLPPHFHVMFVGSRPEFGKQGAAVEILRTLGQALTEAGTGVGAEASSAHSLVLWQRFGLRPNGPEIRLPAHGPSLYPVWAGPGEWHIDGLPSKGA